MKYETPYIEIIKLSSYDCVLASNGFEWDDDWNTDDDSIFD